MGNIASLAPLFGVVGLIFAGMIYMYIKKQPAGSTKND